MELREKDLRADDAELSGDVWGVKDDNGVSGVDAMGDEEATAILGWVWRRFGVNLGDGSDGGRLVCGGMCGGWGGRVADCEQSGARGSCGVRGNAGS